MPALRTKNTAAATIVATKSMTSRPSPLRRRPAIAKAGRATGDDCRQDVSQRGLQAPVPGNSPPEFAHLGGPRAATHPDGRTTKVIAATIGAIATACWVPAAAGPAVRTQAGSGRSRKRHRAKISSCSVADATAGPCRWRCDAVGGKHKSRDHERNSAQSHDSGDVEP